MKEIETTPVKGETLVITRLFEMPLATTWKAWNDADTMKKWWGPKDYTCPSYTHDFKEGGKYLGCMRAPDGKETWSTGVFKEIIDQKKISMTDCFCDSEGTIKPGSEIEMPGNWPDELIITVSFDETEGKTRIMLHHDGLPAEAMEECMQGWQQSLDKLEASVK